MSRGAKRLPAPDQDARDAARDDLDRSWLLEAGAGTGKTTVLVDRVAQIIQRRDTEIDRIAIITFTEKAAGELKLRLRRRLEDLIGSIAPQHSLHDVVRRALDRLDRASVSTIHSFAASLLRDRPVEAQVDPNFAVADALTTTMLMEETWQRWIEQEMSAGVRALARALRLGLSLAQLRELAFGLVAQRDVEPDALGQGNSALESTRDRLIEGIEQLGRLAEACRDESDAGFVQIRALKVMPPALAAARGDRLLSLMERLPLKHGRGSQKAWSPASALAGVKELVESLARLRDEACRLRRTALAHEVAAWIREGFLHAYREAKENRRLLDFADLLIIARNMLRDSRPARVYFQRRFDYLLVDEFQDTDPLQAELLFLLSSDDPDVTQWRRTRPGPGKLFVVGDPKQSIYRFRRADIEVYEEVKQLIAASGGVTDRGLTSNFRSVPSVIGWVNGVFDTLIRPVPGTHYQPAYAPIQPVREEPARGRGARDPGGPRAILLCPAEPGALAECNSAAVREAEARHVAALARRAVEESWRVQPGPGVDPRAIRFRDIALLFRTGTAFETYEDVLREQRIPYRIAGGKRYYLRAEMRALQAVLAAVESPYDDLAVVSALRSPIFGHSDEDLLAHAASRGGWAYVAEGAGRGTPFERAFELLGRLHAARNRRSIAATLEDLFDATGALSLFYLKPDGDQRAANLLKSIDLARAHASLGGTTFGSFVRWLAGMATEEREEGEAPISEETEASPAEHDGEDPGEDAAGDALRILTVHKAKGLEFGMVVLCDAGGGSRASGPTLIVERGGTDPATGSGDPAGPQEPSLQFCLGPAENRLESAGYRPALEREKQRIEAESRRLLYVAATRARDYLVVPVFAGRRETGALALLRQAGVLPDIATRPAGSDESAAAHRGAGLLSGASLNLARADAKPLRILAEEAVPPDPSLALEKEGWRRALKVALQSPTMGREFKSPSGLELPVAPAAGARPPERTAAAVGRAVHAVLERIDLATGRDAGALSLEEATLAGRPDLADEVLQLVRRALSGAIIKEAIAAPRLFREIPFALAGDTYLCEGRADLVFEEGGALTVVDFKTDQVAGEREISERLQRYEPQAAVYALALRQVSGRPVERVVLYFIRPGEERSIKATDSFLARGRALLESGPGRRTRPGPKP